MIINYPVLTARLRDYFVFACFGWLWYSVGVVQINIYLNKIKFRMFCIDNIRGFCFLEKTQNINFNYVFISGYQIGFDLILQILICFCLYPTSLTWSYIVFMVNFLSISPSISVFRNLFGRWVRLFRVYILFTKVHLCLTIASANSYLWLLWLFLSVYICMYMTWQYIRYLKHCIIHSTYKIRGRWCVSNPTLSTCQGQIIMHFLVVSYSSHCFILQSLWTSICPLSKWHSMEYFSRPPVLTTLHQIPKLQAFSFYAINYSVGCCHMITNT